MRVQRAALFLSVFGLVSCESLLSVPQGRDEPSTVPPQERGERDLSWQMLEEAGRAGGFVPDRRPLVHIPTFTGSTASERRLAGWWETPADLRDANGFAAATGRGWGGPNGLPDGIDNLIRRMETMYDRGFRRFSIKLPAGDPDIDIIKGNKMSSSQWWTMEDWMRAGFEGAVRRWILSKDRAGDPVSVGVYMGYHAADSRTLKMDNARIFDVGAETLARAGSEGLTAKQEMLEMFEANIDPWVGAGLREFWFDNSSPEDLWPSMLWLANNPRYRGLAKFHGEAVPATWKGCDFRFVDTAIRRGAWIATFAVAEHRHPDTPVDRGSTELHLWLSGHHGKRCGSDQAPRAWVFADLERYLANGWILGPEFAYAPVGRGEPGGDSWHDYFSRDREGNVVRNDGGGSAFLVGTEMVQRLYDMGWITCVADFNGDGRIEVALPGRGGSDADLRLFEERWNANRQRQAGTHRFADGDVNNDGRIDQADRAFFLNAVQHFRAFRESPANQREVYTPGPGCSVDLGRPD
jgi:hypothetical protein